MSIITLTTDFGLKDHFAGIFKGKIYSLLPETNIVDLSHSIDKFNVLEASYLLSVSYSHFPKGTVHIVAVDASRNADTTHIAMLFDGHYFIGADNGIFGGLINKRNPDKIVQITIHDRLIDGSSDLDVFATVATHLAKGGEMMVIGSPVTEIKKRNMLVPILDQNLNSIRGHIVYIDDFGNCVTNISKKYIEEIAKGRQYSVRFSVYTIKRVKNNYADFKNNTTADLNSMAGNEIAIFNENDFLEIAVYRSNPKRSGSAHTLLGLKIQDAVIVEFES
ncbi:SAM-dependent chlorinase/fluorinase [Flavobacterium sp.]|uniref:SAM hydrolase/SAM-dependent halogenase family protein n=1 Tax=Flavobacterium sp. TaxID=239 RepID=UPI001B66543F|nr:SAM-dependent chlorinase/fluorinase [Flavobacterium sp.]MBP6128001.1 SAM-dependent chlorinase/fluorinase [Flavobacterium sp.]